MLDEEKPEPKRVRGPLSDAEKARIEQLHADDYGRNQIAELMGRPWATITKYCQRAGLTFARHDAAIGVEKQRIEGAQRRATLVLEMLDDAERLRERMFAPTKYLAKFNGDSDKTLSQPIPQDQANLAKAVTTLIDSTLKIEAYDRANSTADVARSMLGRLGDLITANASGPYVPRMPDDPFANEGPVPGEEDQGKGETA
jgi:hypothetical protein